MNTFMKYQNVLKRESEIKAEENFKKSIKFINSKECKIQGTELSDFLQENNIDYLYFESIQDYFDYINEDEDTDLNTEAREYVIFCKSGELFILQSYC